MASPDGTARATVPFAAVALLLGAAVLAATISLDGSLRVTVGLAALAATGSFWGLRLLGPELGSTDVSARTRAIVESGSVGIVCVATGLSLYYVSVHAWTLVTGEAAAFPDLLFRWDANWFETIVQDGYDEQPIQEGELIGQANWAFFPLYPMIVRGVVTLTGMPVATAGTVTSVAALAVGCAFTYRYLVLTRARTVATIGASLLAVGPYSFYAYTLYSEALFVCLIAIGFWALHTRRYAAAALAGAAMSATRGVGVLFGLAFLLHLVWRTDAFDPLRSRGFGRDRATLEAVGALLRDRRIQLGALIPVGLAAFAAYLWWHVGDPMAFASVQSAWGRQPGDPFGRLVDGLLGPHGADRYLAGFGIVGLVAALDLVRRGRPVEGVFGFAMLVVPIVSGLNSIPRYAFGTAVLGYALADHVSRNMWTKALGLVLLGAANVLLLALWFSGHDIVN